LPVAGTIIEVDTPGLTAVNPARFEYKHIRPMYPLVADQRALTQ
jgi:microcystin degradation protein MlrC